MKAFVLIKIRPGEIPEAVHSLRKKKSVQEAYMTFGPYDAVVIVEAEDLTTLGNVITMEIQCVPGVLDTLTCLMVET